METQIMNKLVLAAALALPALSVMTAPSAFAQDPYGAVPYGYGPANGYYDTAPGFAYYGAAPAYGYYDYAPRWGSNNSQRGGPGPRVGAGGGAGIGTQR
jgi:hypothetical protein